MPQRPETNTRVQRKPISPLQEVLYLAISISLLVIPAVLNFPTTIERPLSTSPLRAHTQTIVPGQRQARTPSSIDIGTIDLPEWCSPVPPKSVTRQTTESRIVIRIPSCSIEARDQKKRPPNPAQIFWQEATGAKHELILFPADLNGFTTSEETALNEKTQRHFAVRAGSKQMELIINTVN